VNTYFATQVDQMLEKTAARQRRARGGLIFQAREVIADMDMFLTGLSDSRENRAFKVKNIVKCSDQLQEIVKKIAVENEKIIDSSNRKRTWRAA